MRYEHYEPKVTQDNSTEWRDTVKDALAVVGGVELRNALFEALTATKAYADNEDENMDGHTNELESRLDSLESDLSGAGYDDTELREHAERLEARIEKLEAFMQ